MKESKAVTVVISCDECNEEGCICSKCETEFDSGETIYCGGVGKHLCQDCYQEENP